MNLNHLLPDNVKYFIRQQRKPFLWGGVIAIVVGAAVGIHTQRFVTTAERTSGEIVEIEVEGMLGDHTYYRIKPSPPAVRPE